LETVKEKSGLVDSSFSQKKTEEEVMSKRAWWDLKERGQMDTTAFQRKAGKRREESGRDEERGFWGWVGEKYSLESTRKKKRRGMKVLALTGTGIIWKKY